MKKFFTATGFIFLSVMLWGLFVKDNTPEQPTMITPDDDGDYTGEGIGEMGIGA